MKLIASVYEAILRVFGGAQRLHEAFLQCSYNRGRTLEPLKLLANLTGDVAGDVRLGSHSAVPLC